MGNPKATAAAAATAVLAGGVAAWLLLSDGPDPLSAQAASADTLSAAERAIVAHRSAPEGPEQPIPFSHRFHVSELRMECEYCHTGTRSTQVAVMPSLDLCLGCHGVVGSGLEPIEELRGYGRRGEPVPWRRIYKLPEFVQFAHQPHLRNEIECRECHGPVEEMDRVRKAASLSMGWCLGCHRRQQPAASDVATDYQLARRFPPAEIPEGREEPGLYPRRIATGYAATRGPTDCAACHY